MRIRMFATSKRTALLIVLLSIGIGVHSNSVQRKRDAPAYVSFGNDAAAQFGSLLGDYAAENWWPAETEEDGFWKCAKKWGCHKGYCWAGCNAGIFIPNEWCYTTRGYSQDFNYVRCSRDSECSKCWKCAGSCTV